MRTIPLSQGYEAIVDDADYPLVSQYKWSVNSNGKRNSQYAYRSLPRQRRPQKHLLLHRFIMQPSEQQEIDHIDGNGLNNTRKNLRFCTRRENCWNTGKFKRKCKSSFKGVSIHKASGLWVGYLNHMGRRAWTGYYKSEQEAARARDFVAIQLYGPFARTSCLL